jgi:hypothetical protein
VGAPEWDTAWAGALDEMEIAVREAQALLTDAHRPAPVAGAAWTPPAGIGPLPASLEERARAVLERQLAVAEALAAAMVRSRRQLRALATLAPAPAHPPVYVDVDG